MLSSKNKCPVKKQRMGRQHRHRIYSLTSLQIGDLQSYVSRLYLYLTCESSKLFILVDNGPWLIDNHCRPAQLWQLMVTKSRVSPFANTRARLENEDLGSKVEVKAGDRSANKRDRLYGWFSVINAARWQHRALSPVKELHHTLHGCVAFEVAWADVRGINYTNELQTDTCVALEAKSMTKKEFDSIEQALHCIASHCLQCSGARSGIPVSSEASSIKEIRSEESLSHGSLQVSPWRNGFQLRTDPEDDIFYDVLGMQENLLKPDHTVDGLKVQKPDSLAKRSHLRMRRLSLGNISKDNLAVCQCNSQNSSTKCKRKCQNFGCQISGHYDVEGHSANSKLLDECMVGSGAQRQEESLSEDHFLFSSENSPGSNIEEEGRFNKKLVGPSKNEDNCITRTVQSGFEVVDYKDVLIIFKFSDALLPFELKQIITSDLRLLRLLESGLPSWVIFFQSYPIFCQLYCPWMRPLAKTLYIFISIVTVLIGFYDLYKNVPVLKATAAHICGPLFDWIEAWEMISRLKYLGTMLFLQNFEKALKWFLTIMGAAKQLVYLLTKPMVEPLAEFGEFVLPFWSLCIETVEGCANVVWFILSSAFNGAVYLVQILIWPFLILLSIIWGLVTSILYPIASAFWELVIAPIRLVLKLLNYIALISSEIFDFAKGTWQSLSGTFQLISITESASNINTIPVRRTLWNDLFSQVFRAVRSIVNGFVAFFTACNRHRLSIYNHVAAFFRHLSNALQFHHSADFDGHGPIFLTHRKKLDKPQDMVETDDIGASKQIFSLSVLIEGSKVAQFVHSYSFQLILAAHLMWACMLMQRNICGVGNTVPQI